MGSPPSSGGRFDAMTPELVLAILGAIIIGCVLVLATIAVVVVKAVQIALRSRRRTPAARPAEPVTAQGVADPRTAAAIEAFVAEISGEPVGPVGPAAPATHAPPAVPAAPALPAPAAPMPVAAIAVVREPVAVMAPAVTARSAMASQQPAAPMMPWATWSDSPVAVVREPAAEPISAGRLSAGRLPARGWSPAGLADAATWDRAVREEQARVARFGRPVTVVMAELPHLDDIARRLGHAVADRVVEETARVLVAQGRAEDRIAWLGHARFGVLLVETREAAAGDYVGRVRAAVDEWLDTAGLSIRLSLGWAGASEGGDVVTAAAIAQELLHDGSDGADAGEDTNRAGGPPVMVGALSGR
jgi:diguanylate cyclase (GGDEF)-like protein